MSGVGESGVVVGGGGGGGDQRQKCYSLPVNARITT